MKPVRFVVAALTLWMLGCTAGASLVREGAAGALTWRVEDIGVVTRQVYGRDADAYTFTLVLGAVPGTAITLTTLEYGVSDQGTTRAAPQVSTGQWHLADGRQWRLTFPYSIECQHVPGHCESALTVAPSWRLRFTGATAQGAPVDVTIPVDLPPATIRTIFR